MGVLILAFVAGVLVGYFAPIMVDAIQFHRMANDLESRVEQMSKIVPRRPTEQQPHPSWRVVK